MSGDAWKEGGIDATGNSVYVSSISHIVVFCITKKSNIYFTSVVFTCLNLAWCLFGMMPDTRSVSCILK